MWSDQVSTSRIIAYYAPDIFCKQPEIKPSCIDKPLFK